MLQKITKRQFFFLLLAIQISIILLSIATKQFMSGIMMFGLRIMLLAAAQFCSSVSWSSLYSVFALLSALYSFDPVGLFLTGHGQQKTTIVNIFCVLICILHIFSSYIGYLYTCAIQSQTNGTGDMLFNRNNNPGYLNPNNERQPNYLYNGGGTAFAYNNNQSNNTNNNQQNNFRPFSGPGYSLS